MFQVTEKLKPAGPGGLESQGRGPQVRPVCSFRWLLLQIDPQSLKPAKAFLALQSQVCLCGCFVTAVSEVDFFLGEIGGCVHRHAVLHSQSPPTGR